MPEIKLETKIKSNIKICFDLSRSIDLHKISTAETNEKAIAGITSGLINLDESVTWQAKHFGITQKLTSKITKFESPKHFRDEQQKGIFKFIVHDHYFEERGENIIMIDYFYFQSPFGIIGKIIDKFVMTKYLTDLLNQRNEVIKNYAETEKWKTILND
jgi:ligand-binding SRPBCC domain-containing protein